MSPKEEKRIYYTRKIVYFLLVVLLEILVYTFLYLLFSLINYLHEFHPYLRVVVLIVLFPISYYLTGIIAHSKLIDEIVNGL